MWCDELAFADGGAPTGGIFPFGFCWQAQKAADTVCLRQCLRRILVEPFRITGSIGNSFEPADRGFGQPSDIRCPAAFFTGQSGILVVRDFIFGDIKQASAIAGTGIERSGDMVGAAALGIGKAVVIPPQNQLAISQQFFGRNRDGTENHCPAAGQRQDQIALRGFRIVIAVTPGDFGCRMAGCQRGE